MKVHYSNNPTLYHSILIRIILLLKIPFYAASQDNSNIALTYLKSDQGIYEEKFITINGIKQWVTIKGDNTLNPVILFLHGGPGSILSPYADSIYAGWKKDFILVQWDQRGAGRTYGDDAPAELSQDFLKSHPLTVEQITSDGIELSKYLLRYLGKEKIILLGTSWGSILGAKMAVQHPELYYAYVGQSQIVNPIDDLIYDYQKVLKMAQAEGDNEVVDELGLIGLPPYDHPKNAGKLFRTIRKYERGNVIPAPDSWRKPTKQYDNKNDSLHSADGDDYSFVNYMGFKALGIKSMAGSINLLKDGLDFKVPVYLIQGEEDMLTPKEITNEYFTKINAPKKEFILIPKTGHNFNLSCIEAQYKILKEFILPMINSELRVIK